MSAVNRCTDTASGASGRILIFRRNVIMVAVAVVFLIIAAVIYIYISRGSPLERGMEALIAAYGEKRPVEARLSGGFSAGTFEPMSPDERPPASKDRIKAYELLTEAAKQNDGISQLAYGRLLITEGRTADAYSMLRRAAEMLPDSPEVRNDIGVCLMQRGDLENALPEFERAIQLNSNMPEARFNRSLCYQRLLLIDEAREGYSSLEGLERDPGWMNEINRRIQEVTPSETFARETKNRLDAFGQAFDSGDLETATSIVRQDYETMSKQARDSILRTHLDHATSGDHVLAEASLKKMEIIGNEFLKRLGDSSVIDLVAYLRKLAGDDVATERMLLKEYDRAQALYGANRFKEARTINESLARRHAARQNFLLEVICNEVAAYCDFRLGELEAADQTFVKAMGLARKHKWPFRRASIASMLGLINSRLGKDSAGIKYCEEALQFLEGFASSEAKVLQYLSLAYFRMGNLENRLSFLRQSTHMYLVNAPMPHELASNYYDLASLYGIRGNHDLAMDYARQALKFCFQASDEKRAAQVYSFMATEFAKKGERTQAEEELQRALSFVEEIVPGERPFTESMVLRRAGEVSLELGDASRAIDYYSTALKVAEKSQDAALPMIRVLRGRAKAFARAAQIEKARMDLERAAARLNAYRGGIVERNNRSEFLDANYQVFDELVELNASIRRHFPDTFKVMEESRTRGLLDDIAANKKGTAPSPLTLDEIRRSLPDDLRILEYAITSDRTYIFVITRGEWSVAESAATTQVLDELVQSFVAALKTQPPNGVSLEELRERSQEIYRHLIEPVAHKLNDDKTLCIVPDKSLHFLPFAALVDGAGKYLIESHSLTSAPSASVLVRSIDEAREKPASPDEAILAVGNPRFDRETFTKLQDLIDAEQEAEESSLLYGADNRVLLTGTDATKSRVLQALQHCDVAHLALHCLVEEKSPGLAALVLAADGQSVENTGKTSRDATVRGSLVGTDVWAVGSLGTATRSASPSRFRGTEDEGLLYLDELYSLSLPRTRLVVLSACQTGLGHYYRGEGIVSLVRPFLALRVPTIVASLWSVDSGATASLMIDFHKQRRQKNLSAATALQQAQIKMASDKKLDHPFFWAPFITVGYESVR